MSPITPNLTCVLVVSRDGRIRQDVVSQLSGQDCAVWCVEALDVALAYTAQLLPDILLLDTQISDDIAGFLAGMRAHCGLIDVPALLLEHNLERVDEASARVIGARSALPLPLHPEVLRSHIAAATSRHAPETRATSGPCAPSGGAPSS